MENNFKEIKELSIIDILYLIKRNIYFLMSSMLICIIIAISITLFRYYNNPMEYRYQARSTIELINSDGMTTQPQTVLHVMESSTMLKTAMEKLKISDGKYTIKTDKSTKSNEYYLIGEGPDEGLVVSLVNEINAQTKSIISGSMIIDKNVTVESAHIFGNPIEIKNSSSLIVNLIYGLILGATLGVLVVLIVIYSNGNIYTKEEVEYLLNTKVLAEIPIKKNVNKFAKFFKVR